MQWLHYVPPILYVVSLYGAKISNILYHPAACVLFMYFIILIIKVQHEHLAAPPASSPTSFRPATGLYYINP